MDYSKIRVLMMQRNFSLRNMARTIGVSDSGFKSMMERDTMTIQTLEKISQVFDVPITYFFDDSTTGKKKPCPECIKCNAQLDLLKQQLTEKEKELKELYKEMGRKLGTQGKASA